MGKGPYTIMSSVNEAVATLPGVGPKLRTRLAQQQLYTLTDLLLHLPRRWEDRTRLTPVARLQPGMTAQVKGVIRQQTVVYRGRRQLSCLIDDDTGTMVMRLFHFYPNQVRTLQEQTSILVWGKVRLHQGRMEMVHPQWQIVAQDQPLELPRHLTPIYPALKGIGHQQLGRLIHAALYEARHSINDGLPAAIREQYQLSSFIEALQFVHHPPAECSAEKLVEAAYLPQQRLIFEELLAHTLMARHTRLSRHQHQAPAIPATPEALARFQARLPFTMTGSQLHCAREILQSMQQLCPMARLLQGDVGSGKTVVAAMAMLPALMAGYQVVLMAPTELLAQQHAEQFSQWLAPFEIHQALLVSNQSSAWRREVRQAVKAGSCQLIIGTHALFQPELHYPQLALVIMDEQHRFGVDQRRRLMAKGQHSPQLYPHQLLMSATPIPRTLAMSLYADLDVSSITGLPPGRKPVTTAIVSPSREAQLLARIQHHCDRGGQVYWVCPRIEPDEQDDRYQAAESRYEHLRSCFANLAVGLVHGRLKAADKLAVMHHFKAGHYAILVATTVIEVGVDVPNASVMVIENAESLGLSQLHQLRGRVGRGSSHSHCILFYHGQLSTQARERLEMLRHSQDGFELAQKDLEMRGPGTLYGTNQSGAINFSIAALQRDQHLIGSVREAADWLLDHYPEAVKPLLQRWHHYEDDTPLV